VGVCALRVSCFVWVVGWMFEVFRLGVQGGGEVGGAVIRMGAVWRRGVLLDPGGDS
jgi:hypothetical protein